MKAFLCYPSEHEETAREVKNFVRSVGVGCWFDKDSLVAGEDWDRARGVALAEADVVVILCAIQTTSRNGVYQREVNEALRFLSDRRLGTVYIIPLRLEDAPLPRELSRLQYVDHFTGPWRRKLAAGLSRAVTEVRDHPDRLAGQIERALVAGGAWLRENATVQETLNAWSRATVRGVIAPRRYEIGGFIASVVSSWDTGAIMDKLEQQVGRDLQYIRINGTLVGGLVGLLIYLGSRFFGFL